MKGSSRLAPTGRPILWLLGMVASVGGASLFLSGQPWQWACFAVLQAVTSFALLKYFQRQAWRYSKFGALSEAPLWKAAGEAIHDVGTPLHVMRFCIQQLVETPSIATTPRFVEQLTRSSDRTLETFDKLRVFTRAVRDEEGPVSFRLAYEQALKVVRSRFPAHPALRSLDAALAPDEMVQIGAAPLVRALSILLGRCLSNPGTISVSVEPGSEQLRIAIAGETCGDKNLDLETQSVRHMVEDWDGDLKRTFFPERGTFGYALKLSREVRG